MSTVQMRSAARHILLLALVPLLSLACRSSERTLGPIPGEHAELVEVKVTERSGKTPDWKARAQGRDHMWGEGYATTESKAIKLAEDDMRARAARYLETTIKSESRLRSTNDGQQFSAYTVALSNGEIVNMAVDDLYTELQVGKRIQYGRTFPVRRYRVLVRGTLE